MLGTSHPTAQLGGWAGDATPAWQVKALGPARSAEGPGTGHRAQGTGGAAAGAGADLKREEALHRVGPVQAVETVHPQSAFLKTEENNENREWLQVLLEGATAAAQWPMSADPSLPPSKLTRTPVYIPTGPSAQSQQPAHLGHCEQSILVTHCSHGLESSVNNG